MVSVAWWVCGEGGGDKSQANQHGSSVHFTLQPTAGGAGPQCTSTSQRGEKKTASFISARLRLGKQHRVFVRRHKNKEIEYCSTSDDSDVSQG